MDNLQYIRDAIEANKRDKNNSLLVKVIRWDKEPSTGERSKPFEFLVNAKVALAQFQKPVMKRMYVWRHIRPIGVQIQPSIEPQVQKIDTNSLSDSALFELASNPEVMKALKALEQESKKKTPTETL